MFAVGHLALGHLCGKVASKISKVNVNLPLLFLASVIPDVDLLIPGLEHRGPTHSLILACLIFLPAFLLYGKKAVPYFIALVQHFILGDFLTGGGVQLLWPLNTKWYGAHIKMMSQINILLEGTLFLTSLIFILKTRDAPTLLQPHPTNQILTIPILTVLLPSLFSFPLHVPPELIIPHLTYLTLFTISILKDLKTKKDTEGLKSRILESDLSRAKASTSHSVEV